MKPSDRAILEPEARSPGTWWPARRRVAALAVVTASGTAAGALALGVGDPDRLAALYVLLTIGALLSPFVLTAQVVAGQVLVGIPLLSPDGPGLFLLCPLFAGVVLSAELLAVVARLDMPTRRRPVGAVRRSLLGAAGAIAVFVVVAAAARLPGPSGFVAVGGAAVALVLLGALLGGRLMADGSDP